MAEIFRADQQFGGRSTRAAAGNEPIYRVYVREQQRRGREMFVLLHHAPGHAQADFGEALVNCGGVDLAALADRLTRPGAPRRHRLLADCGCRFNGYTPVEPADHNTTRDIGREQDRVACGHPGQGISRSPVIDALAIALLTGNYVARGRGGRRATRHESYR